MSYSVFQMFIVDKQGNVRPNAQIEVRTEGPSLPLAIIFSDKDGAERADNPVLADADGFARFYAPTGFYRIKASYGSTSFTLRDVSLGGLAAIIWHEEGWGGSPAPTYNRNDALSHLGTAFICIAPHEATPNTEPMVGVGWRDYWDIMAVGGALDAAGQIDLIEWAGSPDEPATPAPGLTRLFARGDHRIYAKDSFGMVRDLFTRIRLGAPTDFYLDAVDGDDDIGDGSATYPWKTMQVAYNTLLAEYDLAGNAVVINMAGGLYQKGLLAFGRLIGQLSFHDCHFKGDEVTWDNVTVEKAGPPPTDYYCFAAAFGAQIKITGMKLQQGPTGAQDLVQAAGSGSVVGIGKVIFGDSINPWTDIIAYDGGVMYIVDNYKISKTFVAPTGTFTNGNAVITSVSDFTGVKLWQGIFAPGKAALDTWIVDFDVGAGTITMSKPATAGGSGVTVACINGGVCHCTVGRNGIIDYMTNGEASVARTVEITGLAAYFQGYQYCNGGRMDMQAVNFINPDYVFGVPLTARALGVCDNYREGVGGHYPPGLFVYFDGANVADGDEVLTISVAAGVQRGQFINGYKSVSVGLTLGSKIATVAALTHIEGGCKINAPGIPGGTDIIGISGSGPYNLHMQNEATAGGTVTAIITGAGVRNGTYIRKIVGTSCYLSQPAVSAHTGIALACAGLQESGGVLV